jgi:hypothetical protein
MKALIAAVACSERERRPYVPGELLVRFERLLTSSDHSVSPSTWFAR